MPLIMTKKGLTLVPIKAPERRLKSFEVPDLADDIKSYMDTSAKFPGQQQQEQQYCLEQPKGAYHPP